MDTIEYIILIIAAILAILFIVRTVVKLAKGEDPCMFCKSCGDDKTSCRTTKENEEKQEEETKED